VDQNANIPSGSVSSSGPGASAPRPIPVYAAQAPPPKKGSGPSAIMWLLRIIFTFIFVCSLILNAYLLLIISLDIREEVYRPGKGANKIALIDLAGAIDMDTAEQMRTTLQWAEEDSLVKGVIIVVNSPGGAVAPSNMIKKYIDDFQIRSHKKVYASIQQLGASGAYWAIAGADKIFAQENSLVGSLGVIYMNFIVEDTLNKLGVTPVVIKSSRAEDKDRNSMFRLPSEQEKAEILNDLDVIHQRFVDVVSKARGLNESQVWEFATGDIYDGPESREKNLIDSMGFLENVIDDMSSAVSLQNPPVIRYKQAPSLFGMLVQAAEQDDPLDIHKQLEKLAMTDRIQALWLGR